MNQRVKVKTATSLVTTGSLVLLLPLLILSGCNTRAADYLNPFATQSDPHTELGELSNRPLLEDGGSNKAADARQALEVMTSYRRAQEPQPYYPVRQAAEVRLMWVPDHTNKAGDLVPAHYYYLRVLDDRWAVQDAFDLEDQLNATSKGSGGATPWVYGDPGRSR